MAGAPPARAIAKARASGGGAPRAVSEGQEGMAQKSEKTGVVISDKMQKSIVVAVEWQVQHGMYGKSERRTATFMVHDEDRAAKVGDTVEIVETRPLSRSKRWTLKRVVRQAAEV